MTRLPDDKDLVERFAELRNAQRGAIPSFANLTARRGRRGNRRAPFALGLAAALMAAAIIGVLVERVRVREAPAPLDLRTARWTAPTDFLLNVPGNWMLRDLPRIAAPASPASMTLDTVSNRRASS
jgi:hypothetical protein